jgi:hypothetical protein
MPPKKFSSHQELIIAGWAVFRDQSRLPTLTTMLKEFVFKEFQVDLNPSWIRITRFVERQHLSLQRPSNMTEAENSEDLRQQGIEFIKMIRGLKKEPHQIVALDKTSFYGDARFIKNISVKGSYVISSFSVCR